MHWRNVGKTIHYRIHWRKNEAMIRVPGFIFFGGGKEFSAVVDFKKKHIEGCFRTGHCNSKPTCHLINSFQDQKTKKKFWEPCVRWFLAAMQQPVAFLSLPALQKEKRNGGNSWILGERSSLPVVKWCRISVSKKREKRFSFSQRLPIFCWQQHKAFTQYERSKNMLLKVLFFA